MSSLTEKLKLLSLHHYNQSGIEDPRAFKIMYKRVKDNYYRLSEDQKAEFLKEWSKK